MTTPFTTLMAQLAQAPDGSTLTVTEDWGQGRTLFGGISAALCVASAQQTIGEGAPPLRSGQFAFIGPASGPFRLESVVLRRGKSTVFVQADLHGEAGLATRALLTFGAARQSAIDDTDLAAPATVDPDRCSPLHPEGKGPGFVANFEIRPADGVAVFSREARESAQRPDLLLWARHRDPAAGMGAPALIALADTPPPAAVRLMTVSAPISTMTWMVDILPPPPADASDRGWRLLRSSAEVTREGYSSQAMTLWDEAGRPLVIGRQNIAVFS
ncbi:MAG TPA: thioesterase family protein [Caulobacter sp.]|nr:thioesterase family protein [Caulobacter sp.]